MTTNPAEYWSARAHRWVDDSYADPASGNVVRLRLAVELLSMLPKGRVLDVGCGSGYVVAALLKEGWNATGVDFAAGMVEVARKYLADQGQDASRASVGSATNLADIGDASCDALTCLGVLQYVEDDAQAYREANRVLRTGGLYVLTHHNELFDLFTFNRYTLAFFSRHYVTPFVASKAEADAVSSAMRALISNPDAPDRHDTGSARDAVFTRSENPLALPEKLRRAGFEPAGSPLFLNMHLVPPLIERNFPALCIRAGEEQYALARDWRGMFAGAQFMAAYRKVAELH